MKEQREQLLEQLYPLIEDSIKKAKGGRFGDEQKAKIRISYINATANLLRSYNAILKDIELETLQEQLEELQNEFKQSKKRFEET